MHVYIIDNYDSFTYNLYQFIGEILTSAKRADDIDAFNITVKRNDEVTLEDIKAVAPDRIIISPGPGSPDDERYFGVCLAVIQELAESIPTLGVCLGMQGMVYAFGGEIIKAPLPMHGKISPIHHNGKGIFTDTPDELAVMRYHSLIASPENFPACLEVTATVGNIKPADFTDKINTKNFEIMAVQHRTLPITGIQFHPESFATEGGKELIANFLFK